MQLLSTIVYLGMIFFKAVPTNSNTKISVAELAHDSCLMMIFSGWQLFSYHFPAHTTQLFFFLIEWASVDDSSVDAEMCYDYHSLDDRLE